MSSGSTLFDEIRGLYFAPIRHHSPACAWHLRTLLAELMPRQVLIEGPIDFDPLIPLLLEAGTRPPVAIVAFAPGSEKDETRRVSYYPFSSHAPEYIALVEGSRLATRLGFIDLPAGARLGLRETEGRPDTIALSYAGVDRGSQGDATKAGQNRASRAGGTLLPRPLRLPGARLPCWARARPSGRGLRRRCRQRGGVERHGGDRTGADVARAGAARCHRWLDCGSRRREVRRPASASAARLLGAQSARDRRGGRAHRCPAWRRWGALQAPVVYGIGEQELRANLGLSEKVRASLAADGLQDWATARETLP